VLEKAVVETDAATAMTVAMLMLTWFHPHCVAKIALSFEIKFNV
jgi:hypothetical protein